MLTRRKLVWLPPLIAMLLSGCGTFGGDSAGTGHPPICRSLNNQRADALARGQALRAIEITEGLIEAGCERRPT